MVLTEQQLEIVLGLEQEDFKSMELVDLERISRFCDHAFIMRKKQRIEELEEKALAFEKKEQPLLEFEPNIKQLYES